MQSRCATRSCAEGRATIRTEKALHGMAHVTWLISYGPCQQHWNEAIVAVCTQFLQACSAWLAANVHQCVQAVLTSGLTSGRVAVPLFCGRCTPSADVGQSTNIDPCFAVSCLAPDCLAPASLPPALLLPALLLLIPPPAPNCLPRSCCHRPYCLAGVAGLRVHVWGDAGGMHGL